VTSMWLAALFWLALHLFVAGPLRRGLVARLGERVFFGLFSLLSVIGLVWLVFAYRAAPFVPLWPTAPWAGYVALPLVLVAFTLVVLGRGRSNPTSTRQKPIGAGRLPVHGITRVTRHPRLSGIALWAMAHLLVNGHLAALLLFGAILVTVLNGMASIDRKRRLAVGAAAWDDFAAHTSRLPFVAILAGRTPSGCSPACSGCMASSAPRRCLSSRPERPYLAGRRFSWTVNPSWPSTRTAPVFPPSKSLEPSRWPVANS
jgi:uncharacterized membrane protein